MTIKSSDIKKLSEKHLLKIKNCLSIIIEHKNHYYKLFFKGKIIELFYLNSGFWGEAKFSLRNILAKKDDKKHEYYYGIFLIDEQNKEYKLNKFKYGKCHTDKNDRVYKQEIIDQKEIISISFEKAHNSFDRMFKKL